MWDPITLRDGHSYEKLAVCHWFGSGNKTSPVTNQELSDFSMVPAISLKSLIQNLVQKHAIFTQY